jgi:ATP-binding cassette subfamily F protein 3
VLALLLWQRPNLLLLDEPTNHLDLEMRLALNQALQGFQGSVILVSHDRHLLRSVCDDLWLVDGGRLAPFDDDLDAYPAWLAKRKSAGSGGASSSGGARKRGSKAQLNRLGKLERQIETLSEARDRLHARLGEDSIYLEENRGELEATLAAQADNQQQLESVEEEWLQLSEALESAQE